MEGGLVSNNLKHDAKTTTLTSALNAINPSFYLHTEISEPHSLQKILLSNKSNLKCIA